MIAVPYEIANDDNNPLDLIEDLAGVKGWKFTRGDQDYITVTIPGQKTSYEVSMEWQEEYSALLFACSVPLEISDDNYDIAADTLEQVNENLWLGHFDLSNKGVYPTFRHTFLLRMIPAAIAIELIADVFEIAVAECNRFYATFQLAQAGDTRLQENLHAAIFETVGEA